MRRWLGRTLALALLLAFAMTAGLCVRRWGFGLTRITGVSMEDTLRSGDVALATRWDYLRGGPARGDVVECRFPARADRYVKRVIGLPGERVALRGGTLYVNSAPLSEPYVSGPSGDYDVELGEDEYLVLGDNRAESYDSRMPDMGTLSASDFLGRVRWVLWPLDRLGPVD